jgi:formylglycine-generating enzyme required for sulfatase activity/serine/threonine protein kinase
MPFRPSPGETLTIDGVPYQAAEHPAAPGMAYGQEGRQGIVFQFQAPDGALAALKLFKARYRAPALVTQAQQIAPFAAITGLEVCARRVFSPIRYAEVVRQYPDLSYAVLMPWVSGSTWLDVILDRRVLTPAQSLAFARSLALLLATMEERGLAHCDLSAPNLLLPGLLDPPGQPPVALVDVEQLFAPGLDRPAALPGGSAGYAHRTAPAGLWSAHADRFAGAVLLAEILGWCDPQVRAVSGEESYFDPEEIQQPSQRYDLLRSQLAQQWGPGVAQLFQQAWESDDLAECPPFGEWLVALPDQVSLSVQPLPVAPTRPATSATSVTPLLTLAADLRAQGNLDGALAAYRGALTLLPAGDGLTAEIHLLIADLEREPPGDQSDQACSPTLTSPPPSQDLPTSQPPSEDYAPPHVPLSEAQRQQIALDIPQPKRGRWPIIAAVLVFLVIAGGATMLFQVLADQQAASVNATATVQTQAAVTVLDPALVEIPAGPFLMGSAVDDDQASVNERPQHTLDLPTYWIGKTEVTNAQFRPFVEGDGYTNQDYWTDAGWAWRTEQQINQPAFWADLRFNGNDQPVVGVSWYEAVAYVSWLSDQTGHAFRLPTEAEWEKAARGSDGLIWPWGNNWEATRANSNNPSVRTASVGQYPSGASPYGMLDMAGNVWEWCATQTGTSYPYRITDEWANSYLAGDVARVMRGGSWYSPPQQVRGAYRSYDDPRHRDIKRGLRVASHAPRPNADS